MENMFGNSERFDYNSLPVIEDISPIDPSDIACFHDIREILIKHGKTQRFGLTLLHKHFDLESGEILLEETDAATRIQTIGPVNASALLAERVIPTAFSMIDGTAEIKCYAGCVVSGSGPHTARHIKSG